MTSKRSLRFCLLHKMKPLDSVHVRPRQIIASYGTRTKHDHSLYGDYTYQFILFSSVQFDIYNRSTNSWEQQQNWEKARSLSIIIWTIMFVMRLIKYEQPPNKSYYDHSHCRDRNILFGFAHNTLHSIRICLKPRQVENNKPSIKGLAIAGEGASIRSNDQCARPWSRARTEQYSIPLRINWTVTSGLIDGWTVGGFTCLRSTQTASCRNRAEIFLTVK